MIIQTLLEQDAIQSSSQTLDDISLILRTECSQFLSNPTPLFRGVKGSRDLFLKARIRTDRRSLSQRNVGTVLFNQIMFETAGISDVRNRCHFLTNSVREAYKYGSPYLAFPVNGSSVLSNPDVADSIHTIGDIIYIITNNLRPLLRPVDSQLIEDAIRQMDVPGASIDVLFDLFERLSPETSKQMQKDWERATNVISDGYSVSRINNVPKYSDAVEYMLYDAPHTYLIHLDQAAELLGTYEHGSAVDTFTEMLANIKSL